MLSQKENWITVTLQLKRPFVNRLAPGIFTLGLVLFLFLPSAFCQVATDQIRPSDFQFDTSGLDSMRVALDYSADVVQKPPVEDENKDNSKGFFEGLNTVAKVFFILFIIGLLVLFIWAIAEQFSKPSNKKVNSSIDALTVDELEDRLLDVDLKSPLDMAIAAGNYNLAVRLLFLALLQKCQIAKVIEWRKDKTNGEYLAELRSKKQFDDFSRLTLVFERVWYGNAKLSQEEFSRIEILFKNAIKAVN